ncbi:DEAD/DEAH box helicase family protein [Aliarcobacter butzleri]|uniref:DEAD/DEAH box helicase family protein n=1 Tax=Aliarcobacter butzleri TaxID=28197 RepID=UPI002B255E92|nr:DEAD/DEAH box helicase family protein [Aliarcobacter butzleri]
MKHDENTRVKIPSILHLTRLGYKYLSLRDCSWDENTNIFKDIFITSVKNINSDKDLQDDDIVRLYDSISLSLENDDLGKSFYERLTQKSGIKLIDFENFTSNTFNVVTELPYKNGEDEFRPDITLLINGMPLVFIEVKKPNNQEGILAERKRIETRFKNKAFKKFINLTQLMIFSNNMEYDNESSQALQGAFYATTSYSKPIFNYFREEESFDLETLLNPIDDDVENFILKDNNLNVIKSSPEFATNKEPNTPTNRLSTSMLSFDRLAFILKYSIAYVHESKGIEKHIMRYPQIFATKAIKAKLDDGVKKGIIWHTQGSGKTALTYYNVKHLSDYFQQKGVIAKFYFIVDRIDLLDQSKREFSSRGLKVHTISSREDFKNDIKKTTAINNDRGELEITVVNIQKFQDDPDVARTNDYNLEVQRVYFLDEVHRSYNPKGSFLANLNESDKNAIKIGLTGTPLLGDDYNSKSLFGNYIHKYYYNSSIADGYTLRLIREEIETNYKIELEKILSSIEIEQGSIAKKDIYSHKSFVEPMFDYIVNDFENSRVMLNDNSIGAMVICESSEQAKMMFEIFNKKYANRNEEDEKLIKKAALILHDIGTKQERKDWVDEFKDGKIDILFVYNMLLTGFDAKRLKKLYLGRVIKKHNLLQALTRVNRTYKDFKYGFVVDFADISLESEEKIANVLSSLDSKIELNNKINKELEVMAKTLYDYWFVQFDFPDEKGKPYKSSGGKMVYNQELKREIPDEWEVKTISNLLNVVTGKEDANFAVENGEYPFFTCSENTLSCNDYAFEGKAILIAGNGNFNVKLYEGKFNAYQRTYVLIPDDEEFYSVIFYAVKDQLKRLSSSSAGSIIKFITKGDVDNIPLVLPTNGNYKIFDKLNNITALIEQNIEQNQELAKLRDWLLPMLMNGQVKVK